MPIIRKTPNYLSEATQKEKDSQNNIRKINKKMDLLNQKMDGLYKDIYITRPDDRQNMNTIIDKLDTAIDHLQNTDSDVSGMSELLRRIDMNNTPNTDRYLQSVQDLFSDQGVLNSLFRNDEIHELIAAQNYQFDLICRYLPKLQDALEVKRDAVLSSDNFSKDFLNAQSTVLNKEESATFMSNAKRMEDEYDLARFYDKTYMNCSKYGEDFIYIVPYNIAFKRIIQRSNYRQNNARLGQYVSFYESGSYNTKQVEQIVCENYTEEYEFKQLEEISGYKIDASFKGHEVNLHFNDDGIILNSVNERVVLENKSKIKKFESLTSVFESSLQDKFQKIKDEDLNKHPNFSASFDGLTIPDALRLDDSYYKIDKNMSGAVIERLPRENVVPVYIGKKCVGYYYLEFAEDPHACGFCGGHHMTPGITNSQSMSIETSQDQQEIAIRYIASRISQSIDSHFINANKDLKEEIYAVLRGNEKFEINRSNDIGVTFIPAEDMVHCYFDIDEYTHRGISDLQNSLIPAMLYILLYLTDIIGKITRSTDRRIYYVKQNVEQNVARTMMNVVAQIKKGNLGMRQIESMNNILNIVGKFNDFVIPMGPSGDPPIQFEVMQGQEISTPTDIMEKMEEAAVNATGTPLEMVNSTLQQDFAIRFTMSNTRFLKSIYTRQRITQKFFSQIYTKIYNYEYEENYVKIPIILPPPTYLTATNNQQLFDNQAAMADKIIETHMSTEPEDVKMEFKNLYIKDSLSTYMDYKQIDRLLEESRVNIEAKRTAGTEDGANVDQYL